MEWSFRYAVAWSTLLFLVTLILKLKQKRTNLPPGPPAWPIIGNVFNLGTLPHRTLYELKFMYGPVIWLRLGFTNALVIQSTKAAEHLFKNHDVSCSDRKVLDAFTAHNYISGSLALCSYGSNWRTLRRLVTLELTTTRKINMSIHVRRKCVDKMIRFIEEDTQDARARGESGEIVLSRYVSVMAFNLMGNLIFSRDLVDSRSEDGSEFFDALDKVMKWGGMPNLSEFFPFVRVFDVQRIRKNMEIHLGRAMNIVEKFMKERIEERKKPKEKETKDFLDCVLEFEDDGKEGHEKMSFHQMLIIILEMFFAGTETTSGTIDWVMAELFHNSKAMIKVKEELDKVVGPRKVEESDLDKLPYLQAVIKETMRLHPILPLLIARMTTEEIKLMEYVIPKGTHVFVSAWAIGRDPDTWKDPMSFKPERFIGCEIDYKGQHFELIPFGSGRRICVGMGLAHRTLHFTVASLLHSFDWQLDEKTTAKGVDMEEKLGFTVKKSTPLKAIPKKRELAE